MTQAGMATSHNAGIGSNAGTAGSFGFGLRGFAARGVIAWPVMGMLGSRKGVCLNPTLSSIGPAEGLRSKAVWG